MTTAALKGQTKNNREIGNFVSFAAAVLYRVLQAWKRRVRVGMLSGVHSVVSPLDVTESIVKFKLNVCVTIFLKIFLLWWKGLGLRMSSKLPLTIRKMYKMITQSSSFVVVVGLILPRLFSVRFKNLHWDSWSRQQHKKFYVLKQIPHKCKVHFVLTQ